MDMKIIVIDSSHRPDGNTSKICKLLAQQVEVEVKHLVAYDIGHYDYQFRNAEDDFIPLIKEVATYDTIILATPVYWYTMSGRLKVFLDRISDCLTTEKAIGRSLAGKSLGVLSCGSREGSILGFFEPFKLTADYLDMNYIGSVETWIDSDHPVSTEVLARLQTFALSIQ